MKTNQKWIVYNSTFEAGVDEWMVSGAGGGPEDPPIVLETVEYAPGRHALRVTHGWDVRVSKPCVAGAPADYTLTYSIKNNVADPEVESYVVRVFTNGVEHFQAVVTSDWLRHSVQLNNVSIGRVEIGTLVSGSDFLLDDVVLIKN